MTQFRTKIVNFFWYVKVSKLSYLSEIIRYHPSKPAILTFVRFLREIIGTVKLLCGESMDVEGMIVRKKRVDIYMNVNLPIVKNILMREQQQIDHTYD